MNKLLRYPEVCARTGLSRTRIYETPDFPKAVPIGTRAVAWVEAEVAEWIERRIAQREAA